MNAQNFSESLDKIFPALVAAQAEFPPIPKDGYNPHFKSKFSSLSAVRNATTPVLAKHGLGVLQFPTTTQDGKPGLMTWLIHESGQWINGETVLELSKHDPQSQGGAITYLRRYAWTAALGLVADEDDDGHAASMPSRKPPQMSPTHREMARVQDAAKRAGKSREDVEALFLKAHGKPLSEGNEKELAAIAADLIAEALVREELS